MLDIYVMNLRFIGELEEPLFFGVKKVENPSFVQKAPKEILEKEKEKLEDAKKILVSYKTQLAGL